MILHFTGADCSGKSTMCDKVTKITKGIYTHFDKPKDLEDGKKQYYDFLNNVDPNKTYICDRFHDGEWVYAPLYRGYTGDYLAEFENEIRKKDTYLLVYVTAQLYTLLNRARKRGEDFVKEEDFSTVLNNFKYNYMLSQTMPFLWIDTTTNSSEYLLKKVMKAKDNVEIIYDYLKAKNDELTHPMGNINARYMIVDNDYNKCADELRLTNEYLKCWFTTLEDETFVKLQYRLIKPDCVVVSNEEMLNKLSKILYGTKIILLNDLKGI